MAKRKKEPSVRQAGDFLEAKELIAFARDHSIDEVYAEVVRIPPHYLEDWYINELGLRRYKYLADLLARWRVGAALHRNYELDRYIFAYVENVQLAVTSAEDAEDWVPVLREIKNYLPLVAQRALSNIRAKWLEDYDITVD